MSVGGWAVVMAQGTTDVLMWCHIPLLCPGVRVLPAQPGQPGHEPEASRHCWGLGKRCCRSAPRLHPCRWMSFCSLQLIHRWPLSLQSHSKANDSTLQRLFPLFQTLDGCCGVRSLRWGSQPNCDRPLPSDSPTERFGATLPPHSQQTGASLAVSPLLTVPPASWVPRCSPLPSWNGSGGSCCPLCLRDAPTGTGGAGEGLQVHVSLPSCSSMHDPSGAERAGSHSLTFPPKPCV